MCYMWRSWRSILSVWWKSARMRVVSLRGKIRWSVFTLQSNTTTISQMQPICAVWSNGRVAIAGLRKKKKRRIFCLNKSYRRMKAMKSLLINLSLSKCQISSIHVMFHVLSSSAKSSLHPTLPQRNNAILTATQTVIAKTWQTTQQRQSEEPIAC